MTYADREISTDAASPVELYEFRRGSSAWRYTSGSQDVVYNAFPYTAVLLKRGSIEQTNEIGRAGLRITLARDVEVVGEFIAQTVQRWDAAETAERVELAVGRDLQFIRINGTVVGCLAGLAIHAISLLVR